MPSFSSIRNINDRSVARGAATFASVPLTSLGKSLAAVETMSGCRHSCPAVQRRRLRFWGHNWVDFAGSTGVARYGGLTGSPDESGSKRRERGLARAGNARVRRGMIQLAWRWLMFQDSSELTQWYRTRTAGAKPALRKTMIVALACKLLIALWRYVTTGENPAGAALRPASA